MKSADIQPDSHYHDGKRAVRTVLRVAQNRIYFKVIRAKPGSGLDETLQECSKAEFARWAVCEVPLEDLWSVLLRVRMKGVNLSPAQAQGLQDVVAGIPVTGKVRTSLLERDLVSYYNTPHMRLTPLGELFVQTAQEEHDTAEDGGQATTAPAPPSA